MRAVKQVLRPERVRLVPQQFSWIDQALVQHGLIDRMSARAAALYLFVVTVADAQGLSYYGCDTLARRLRLSGSELIAARTELIALELIAYQAPLYQVLSLRHVPPRTAPPRAAPSLHTTPAQSQSVSPPAPPLPPPPRQRSNTAAPVSLAQLIALERCRAQL